MCRLPFTALYQLLSGGVSVSLIMLEFLFKVKETTRRGKVLKTLISADDVSFGKILLSNACSTCETDVKECDPTIECSQCKEKFHIPCLKHPLPSDFVEAFSANPCLWWFCARCVVKAEATQQTSVKPYPIKDSTCSDSQVNLMNSISAKFVEQFNSLKSELTLHMDNVIETKFSTIASKLNPAPISVEDTPAKAPLYSSMFPSPNTTSPPTKKAAQPPQLSTTKIMPTSNEILVLSPINDDSVSSDTMTTVKKLVEKKLKNCQVESLNCNARNNKISIGFPTSDIRDKADALINTEQSLESLGYKSKIANKMLPKVTIFGVSSDVVEDIVHSESVSDVNMIRDLEKHQIVTKIVEKNPQIKALYDLGHTLKVVYLKKDKRVKNEREYTDLTVGVKVSPSIYQVIFGHQQGSVYLGNRRYTVNDRFYMKTCYHCQMIGHTSNDCEDAKSKKLPVCMYCMGKHRSSSCPHKKNKSMHVCARCLASPHHGEAENSKTHNSGSLECPVLVRETARLAANTDFTSKNVM